MHWHKITASIVLVFTFVLGSAVAALAHPLALAPPHRPIRELLNDLTVWINQSQLFAVV